MRELKGPIGVASVNRRVVHPGAMTLATSTLDSVIVIWHVAVNNQDSETAAAACTDDLVLAGPEGTSTGRNAMRTWVDTAGVRLMPGDCYDVPGGIVVAQDAFPTDNSVQGPVKVFSTFGLRGGLICSIHRFTSFEEALTFPLTPTRTAQDSGPEHS